MKIKKSLFLIAPTVSLLVLALMTWAGTALAAPQPLDTHQPLSVAGTAEFVDWVFGDPADQYVENGNLYSPGHVVTWQLHGSLQGTYIQTITYFWPLDSPDPNVGPYGIVGRCTFEGTILGVETRWTADVEGSGLMDLSDLENHPFKGEDSWTSALTRSASPLSHMRGNILMEGVFDEPWSSGPYTYTGTLVWQTGEKN
jgi:hypothetical protein